MTLNGVMAVFCIISATGSFQRALCKSGWRYT